MIEVPRAALRANRIALNCDFFSFGTNDLTQMTYGYSRDDMGTFLPVYIAEGILPEDPFSSLDQYGVGELVAIGTRRGREVKPKLKVGVCGEHGGDPRSIEFFNHVGLDYVVLLAVPRSGRAAGGGAGVARREERRRPRPPHRGKHAGGACHDASCLRDGPPEPPADLVLVSAKIWTGDPKNPEAEALAVRGGRIVAVGIGRRDRARSRARRRSSSTASGAASFPGFIDCHTHMSSGGFDLLALDLRQTKDGAEFTRMLAAYAKTRPAGEWLTDGAWDQKQWTPPRPADEGPARSGDRRPPDVPLAPGRPHDGLQQPGAEARGRHGGDARSAGRRDRARTRRASRRACSRTARWTSSGRSARRAPHAEIVGRAARRDEARRRSSA